jgi:hypothetical protein
MTLVKGVEKIVLGNIIVKETNNGILLIILEGNIHLSPKVSKNVENKSKIGVIILFLAGGGWYSKNALQLIIKTTGNVVVLIKGKMGILGRMLQNGIVKSLAGGSIKVGDVTDNPSTLTGERTVFQEYMKGGTDKTINLIHIYNPGCGRPGYRTLIKNSRVRKSLPNLALDFRHHAIF